MHGTICAASQPVRCPSTGTSTTAWMHAAALNADPLQRRRGRTARPTGESAEHDRPNRASRAARRRAALRGGRSDCSRRPGASSPSARSCATACSRRATRSSARWTASKQQARRAAARGRAERQRSPPTARATGLSAANGNGHSQRQRRQPRERQRLMLERQRSPTGANGAAAQLQRPGAAPLMSTPRPATLLDYGSFRLPGPAGSELPP